MKRGGLTIAWNASPARALGVKPPIFIKQLRSRLLAACKLIDPLALEEFSVVFVDDDAMADLHLQFMKIPGPTDVLTFPVDESDDGAVLSGEVIVCVPEAERRAAEHQTPLSDELLLYAVHGLLHLAGFDDRTPRDFKIMHTKEDEILTAIGIGPVFKPRKTRQTQGAR